MVTNLNDNLKCTLNEANVAKRAGCLVGQPSLSLSYRISPRRLILVLALVCAYLRLPLESFPTISDVVFHDSLMVVWSWVSRYPYLHHVLKNVADLIFFVLSFRDASL
jgi:hypothetical protein